MLKNKLMNPKPNIQVGKEASVRLKVDADRTLGPAATIKMVNIAIETAKKVGICLTLAR